MIIACDLDRTLLPNGAEPDDGSLERFYRTIEGEGYTLAYVSGRSLELVRKAYEEFGLRLPDYLLASVGTEVLMRDDDALVPDPLWHESVYAHNPKWDRDRIVNALASLDSLTLQEQSVQNEFKLSFYVDLETTEQEIREKLEDALSETTDIEIIYSIDPHKQIGLIDILPSAATKLGALEYLRAKLDEPLENVIYAGDSGNDILPLTYGYKAIVVKNAPESVKEAVAKLASEKGLSKNTYIAAGALPDESGNYASGVIEGLSYFLGHTKH